MDHCISRISFLRKEPEMEVKIPIRIKYARRELPPYETNGNVIPTTGNMPRFIPILMKACVEIRKNELAAKILMKASSVL